MTLSTCGNTDLLAMIGRCRSLAKLPLLVRAHACKSVAIAGKKISAVAAREYIRDAEIAAQWIEDRIVTVRSAKAYLRGKGYL